jgi:hypothetical protein
LLNIRSTLAAITTANGYKTQVATSSDSIVPLEDVPSSMRPYTGWMTGTEVPQMQPFGAMRWVVPVVVVGYVTATAWADRSAAINNLADDILAALSVDTTRGGYAVMTTIRGIETNENDPDAGVDGYCILDFEIVYNRTTSAS